MTNVIEGRATKNVISNPQTQCPEQKQKVVKNIDNDTKQEYIVVQDSNGVAITPRLKR